MLCGVRECFSCCMECGSVSHAVWSVEGSVLHAVLIQEYFACCLECRRECFSCGIVKFVRECFSSNAAEITSVDVVN